MLQKLFIGILKPLPEKYFFLFLGYLMRRFLIYEDISYGDLLHLLLHSMDCSWRCCEGLDGLTGWSKDTLVLDGHWLELR